MRQIHSLSELSLAERKKVRFVAIGIGLLTCFIGISILYCLDIYPFTDRPKDFFAISCLVSIVPPLFLFALGYAFGDFTQLMDLGYKRAYEPNCYSPTNTQYWGDHELHRITSSSSSPSMSINPASGLPMSGSSGMDCRGNPFGSNSWT
ncbi:hypothetical protein A6J40_02055 [Legionella longbeachae]|uniref:hypothetical protein n=1 Tax=Legionella longbeachae TaxID=450 RepID=UPI0009B73ACD|nr:hypothetical protein [Legionella longbeachae]VEE02694.1 Uncharacterised protein [Legionella oakridgensis]ARB91042.1 hypothetical protein A6J40_02055 [Legionella longbeachae]ARM32531.1 hypothetical protein B0B39_02860 [Legionella longbeachae]RZV21167.1 hypothetical protein EKG34_17085 [Legionella longbeachae]UAK45758.1 hypothetical protein K8O86_13310 [Legionella longbeachae]